MIAAYKAAGIPPEHVFAQSFNLDDILFWVKSEPAFGAQAVSISRSATKRPASIRQNPRPGNRRWRN
jgi:glycerophosphoryl diester phosphodiesterase